MRNTLIRDKKILKNKEYKILKNNHETSLFEDSNFWKEIPELSIINYLWINNNYRPKVVAKLCYSDSHLFTYFKVCETEITARFTKINDPVHKDSCVEFFVDLFPNETDKYFNFEINPLGTIHVGYGEVGSRIRLTEEDIKLIEINSTLTKPVVGNYGQAYWEVFYKIPISLFEKYYGMNFIAEDAKGNFYKCGDESKFEHYGVWNYIDSVKPNFHLPKYFGDLIFEK